MGDKPKEIIGSNEWIGAFEVSLCLNKFLGIDSKIMNLASGGELPSRLTELIVHFRE